MEKPAQAFLAESVDIVRSNSAFLILPFASGFVFYLLLMTPKDHLNAFYFLSLLSMLIFCPLIYGRYIEIVTDGSHISWYHIFQRHWLNYFVVSMMLLVPIFFVLFLAALFKIENRALETLLSAIIAVFGIYIYPLVFFMNERVACVTLGVKCLIGNLKFSTPLIVLTLMVFALNLLFESTESSAPLHFLLGYIIWVVTLLIDFIVFVAASTILKEKMFKSN